jgi:hypothetical protein
MRRTPPGFLLAALLFACTDDAAITTGTLPLAEGNFYDLHWGGTQIERFFAIARADAPSSRNVMLISPEHKEPCSLGDQVAGTWVMQPQSSAKYVIGSPSPTRIGIFSDVAEDGTQTLSFADIHCQKVDLELRGAPILKHWNLYSPNFIDLKLLVWAKDQSLTLLDPWQGEQRVVARSVTVDPQWFQTEMWFLDGGEVVRLGHDGSELSRRGSGVTSFSRIGEKDDFTYSDAKGTFVVRSGKTKQIGPEGSCGPTPVDAFISGGVAFFSPCDSNRLVVAHDASGKRYEYESNVAAYVDQPGALLFMTSTDSTTKLWRAESAEPSKAVLVRETERFSGLVRYLPLSPSLSIMIVQRKPNAPYSVWSFDPTDEDPAAPVTVVREGVLTTYPIDDTIFAYFDTGDLVVFDQSFTKELFHAWSDPNGQWPDSAFGGKASALAYLSDFDRDTGLGRLQLHLLNGTHFELAADVRQFQEVWWPERGLVYIQGGDKPGVNFARVDIPCETTSDTAWACGF